MRRALGQLQDIGEGQVSEQRRQSKIAAAKRKAEMSSPEGRQKAAELRDIGRRIDARKARIASAVGPVIYLLEIPGPYTYTYRTPGKPDEVIAHDYPIVKIGKTRNLRVRMRNYRRAIDRTDWEHRVLSRPNEKYLEHLEERIIAAFYAEGFLPIPRSHEWFRMEPSTANEIARKAIREFHRERRQALIDDRL